MRTPTEVSYLEYDTDCIAISNWKWNDLMEGATIANKQVIDKLVKRHLPNLHDSLALDLYNPYKYYKTEKHLVLVHSGIEYFLKYQL